MAKYQESPRSSAVGGAIKQENKDGLTYPTVQLCPINVQQGDSILVKLKYKEGQEYNYLIDGGHAKHFSNIEHCMKECGVMNGAGVQLHGIIVTHPDADHMNGIIRLLEKYSRTILNEYNIVVTDAFYWRGEAPTKLMEQIDNVCIEEFVIGGHTCLGNGLKCYFPIESGHLLSCKPKDDIVRHLCTQQSKDFLKKKPEGVDSNETSILTTLNESMRSTCDVVLTGDSSAEEIIPLVEGKEIKIFQVPHHGSSANSRLKHKYKFAEYFGPYNLSTICGEEVKEIYQFYNKFTAQCYLISAGGTVHYNHPHSSVLQGIILANSYRRHTCVILLTNGRGLNSEKIQQLHQLVPQWTQYVKIYHYDDVFFTTDPCYVRLHPESCISDVRESILINEWTPEEYINKTRFVVPMKPTIGDCRPLKTNRFVEKSTAEITIPGIPSFNAHLICVPLPHNPRSGDSINCCYVIEESMAPGLHFSETLFLLNNDKSIQSLSRAKEYILFQYINNEWQKKQLPATVKDISPTTSPCSIPYHRINSLWPRGDIATAAPTQRCTGELERAKQPSVVMPSLPQPSVAIPSLPQPSVAIPSFPQPSVVIPLLPQPSVVIPSLPQYGHHKKEHRHTLDSMMKIENEIKSPTKSCGCKTGCATNRCGCKKRGTSCGPSCDCRGNCNNNVLWQYAPHQPEKDQWKVCWDTTDKIQRDEELTTKGCGCKTGCATKRCGCKKRGTPCGPSCDCRGNCNNNVLWQYAPHQPEKNQWKVCWDTTDKIRRDEELTTKGCGCKTGCATKRCGCKKRGLSCGPSCMCSNCENIR